MINGRKVTNVALNAEHYELTFDDGQKKQVGIITSQGVKITDETDHNLGHFRHKVHFSDGTVQQHIVSSKTLTIPDYPALQPH